MVSASLISAMCFPQPSVESVDISYPAASAIHTRSTARIVKITAPPFSVYRTSRSPLRRPPTGFTSPLPVSRSTSSLNVLSESAHPNGPCAQILIPRIPEFPFPLTRQISRDVARSSPRSPPHGLTLLVDIVRKVYTKLPDSAIVFSPWCPVFCGKRNQSDKQGLREDPNQRRRML